MGYSRVLLKLSGEVLLGGGEFGIDSAVIHRLAEEIALVHQSGIEVAMVVGGGNIFRGVSGAAQGIERSTADYMGMLGTAINALALQNALERLSIPTRVISAIPMSSFCEPYVRRRAVRHLEKKRVVIFAAGTGSPYFTTDTAAALRASEMGCEVLLKGTKVDGVYSADPVKDKNAERFETLSFDEVLNRGLQVMDATAIALARENNLPIVVFSIQKPGELHRVVQGQGTFTLVRKESKNV